MTTVPYTFGTESSPIPLSQLDANFAVNPTYANTAGNVVNPIQTNITQLGALTNLSVNGNITAGGNITNTGFISATGLINSGASISAAGNITTNNSFSAYGNIIGNKISATGNITGGNFVTGGVVSSAGNVIGGNLTTDGNVTSTGYMSAQGNVLAQGIISATGNIVTAANFVGNFLGNITGNLSVGGSNTQVLFNLNGNVGAAGGLTYNKDSNVLTVLGTVSAQSNISIGRNASIVGNLSVGGTSQLTGVVTGPTAPTGTANNQLATTVFVNNAITVATGSLGTMSQQNANNVSITGGNVTVTAINTPTWTIQEFGGTLYFQNSGSNVAKLDSAGNFTTIGNVTGFGVV